ncbi:hypothetical protein MRX96_000260 [Rhipicephalus microplus]
MLGLEAHFVLVPALVSSHRGSRAAGPSVAAPSEAEESRWITSVAYTCMANRSGLQDCFVAQPPSTQSGTPRCCRFIAAADVDEDDICDVCRIHTSSGGGRRLTGQNVGVGGALGTRTRASVEPQRLVGCWSVSRGTE